MPVALPSRLRSLEPLCPGPSQDVGRRALQPYPNLPQRLGLFWPLPVRPDMIGPVSWNGLNSEEVKLAVIGPEVEISTPVCYCQDGGDRTALLLWVGSIADIDVTVPAIFVIAGVWNSSVLLGVGLV